jgi:hypothetical protein
MKRNYLTTAFIRVEQLIAQVVDYLLDGGQYDAVNSDYRL